MFFENLLKRLVPEIKIGPLSARDGQGEVVHVGDQDFFHPGWTQLCYERFGRNGSTGDFVTTSWKETMLGSSFTLKSNVRAGCFVEVKNGCVVSIFHPDLWKQVKAGDFNFTDGYLTLTDRGLRRPR